MQDTPAGTPVATPFSGNICIFQAFDIGEDIDLERLRRAHPRLMRPYPVSKYFKNYHAPLAIELPEEERHAQLYSSKLHSFGVISLAYKIPFCETLETLRSTLATLDTQFHDQSVKDAHSLFEIVSPFVKRPRFFHLRTAYVVIQVDPHATELNVVELKSQYGGVIASLLRFEQETLSEYQKDEILDDAFGYYRGDLFVVDTEAAFVYDDEYEELLDLFEFGNIQQLELQYFDRILDQQLNIVYQQEVRQLPLTAYLPFIGSLSSDPVDELGRLKVDISVIIERLESSIKVAGEAYVLELYALLIEKLDLKRWKDGINTKLEIIKDINAVYQNKTDSIREDLLSVLIIVLIFIELVVGILSYLK